MAKRWHGLYLAIIVILISIRLLPSRGHQVLAVTEMQANATIPETMGPAPAPRAAPAQQSGKGAGLAKEQWLGHVQNFLKWHGYGHVDLESIGKQLSFSDSGWGLYDLRWVDKNTNMIGTRRLMFAPTGEFSRFGSMSQEALPATAQ